jgi:malate synthase
MENVSLEIESTNPENTAIDRMQIAFSDCEGETLLSEECREFLLKLHEKFDDRRLQNSRRRVEFAARLIRGERLTRPFETESIRNTGWRVASVPRDLEKRHGEITGPAEPKMMINALNSGANVFMADCEDSLSPTWKNVIGAQDALYKAVRRTLEFHGPNGKEYLLGDNLATLVMRPRGWHLPEKHVVIDGRPMSASLFDFGVYFFHNAFELIEGGSGPYFYLPKMESYMEARLWNDVFNFAQEELGIARGTIRATVLIETIPAAFQMEEILYELREHAAGLNAGRWDYLFSMIKKFHFDSNMIFPDRGKITMRSPFMQAYCEALIEVCHKRGAHAIGGMAAFIPNRHEPEVTETALAQVKEDKWREAHMGFDGTWVAHPDLIEVARKEFSSVLGSKIHQKTVLPTLASDHYEKLVPTMNGTGITLDGVRLNIGVCIEYIAYWLEGTGAVAIHNLMEDAATAEIARSQLWQWRHHRVRLDSGEFFTADLYESLAQVEMLKLLGNHQRATIMRARAILDELVLSHKFASFLTIDAYPYLM